MDLFQSIDIKNLPGTPLPEILRPVKMAELVGQGAAVDQLRRYIQAGYLPNLILWGPPGTGKTSYARILAQHFESLFIALNAVQSGAKELREICEQAKQKRLQYQQRTILFVDEIHRFNRAQQDVLLPFIEVGDVTLIGATTENPSYELNKAILSRCRLIVFQKISNEEMQKLLDRAVQNQFVSQPQLASQPQFSVNNENKILESDAAEWLLNWSDGDARKMYLALEEVFASYKVSMKILSKSDLTILLGQIVLGHDKSSDSHYDLISAMIKSIRGSDADAGLYYLARLIKGGEDPVFIARRLIILASEDVGNADPRGIQVAIACAQAVEMVGLPEGGISLAQAVTYLSSAPKSNRSYLAFKQALQLVEQTGSAPVPEKLRSAQTSEMKNLGYGVDYQYPHNFPRHWVMQNYLPNEVVAKLYEPAEIGFEKQIIEFQKWLRQEQIVKKEY